MHHFGPNSPIFYSHNELSQNTNIKQTLLLYNKFTQQEIDTLFEFLEREIVFPDIVNELCDKIYDEEYQKNRKLLLKMHEFFDIPKCICLDYNYEYGYSYEDNIHIIGDKLRQYAKHVKHIVESTKQPFPKLVISPIVNDTKESFFRTRYIAKHTLENLFDWYVNKYIEYVKNKVNMPSDEDNLNYNPFYINSLIDVIIDFDNVKLLKCFLNMCTIEEKPDNRFRYILSAFDQNQAMRDHFNSHQYAPYIDNIMTQALIKDANNCRDELDSLYKINYENHSMIREVIYHSKTIKGLKYVYNKVPTRFFSSHKDDFIYAALYNKSIEPLNFLKEKHYKLKEIHSIKYIGKERVRFLNSHFINKHTKMNSIVKACIDELCK